MKSKLLGAMAAALLLCSMSANALLIEITGQGSADGQWDVTTLTGSFNDLFATLDDQVWWGDGMLAGVFAEVLAGGLDFPNSDNYGPLFAYAEGSPGFEFNARTVYIKDPTVAEFVEGEGTFAFAVASRAQDVPVPATLALLGLGLVGLGLSRRRKSA